MSIKYMNDEGIAIYDEEIKAYIRNQIPSVPGAVSGVKGDAETEYRSGQVNLTKANIGLANVENKSSATIRGELTSADVTNALGFTPINSDVHVSQSNTTLNLDRRVLLSTTDTDDQETGVVFKNTDFTYNSNSNTLNVKNISNHPQVVYSSTEPAATAQQSTGLLDQHSRSPYRKEKAPAVIRPQVLFGAADGDRTRTIFLPRDFKSLASASSATAAGGKQ